MLRKLTNFISISRIPKRNSVTDSINTKVTGVLKDPALYQNNNTQQRTDAVEVLEEYSSKIKWKKDNAKILDIGSGDGGVTVQVLKPFLPRNFDKLIGCDISREMVDHANLHHKEERIEFKVQDIAGNTTHLKGQFNHIFSFYTLHWVQEQEKALSNIHSLLAPEGDCLLLFFGHQPIYNTFRALASTPAWSRYMRDVEQYICPYHDSQKPEEAFRNILIKTGFEDLEVQYNKKHFISTFDELKKALRSVNPFVHRMSPDLKELYMDDYMKEVMKLFNVRETSGGNDHKLKIKIHYDLLVGYAAKREIS